MYYSERCFEGTTVFALFSTVVNYNFVRNNYFAKVASARIVSTWKYWALTNLVVISMLLRPLTQQEMAQQWRKRKIMGKYLYSLYHLDEPETEEAKH